MSIHRARICCDHSNSEWRILVAGINAKEKKQKNKEKASDI